MSLFYLQTFLNRLFKHTCCLLCLQEIKRPASVCQSCWSVLPWITNACHSCAIPLEDSGDVSEPICGQCLKKPLPMQRTIAALQYQKPIQGIIYALKFSKKHHYAPLLATLLADKVRVFYADNQLSLPDIIIPIPLHKKRLRKRGYNQTLEIARPLAKELNIPLQYKNIQRTRNTQPQAEMKAGQRHKNVANAFRVDVDLTGQHVAIIDDVYTTGNTSISFSQTLLATGARAVDVWCCARAVWKKHS